MKNNIPPLNLDALDGDELPPLSKVSGKISEIGVVLGPISQFLLGIFAVYSILYSQRMTLWWASEIYGWCGTERMEIHLSVLTVVPTTMLLSTFLYFTCRRWLPQARFAHLFYAIIVSVMSYTFLFVSGLSAFIAYLLRS